MNNFNWIKLANQHKISMVRDLRDVSEVLNAILVDIGCQGKSIILISGTGATKAIAEDIKSLLIVGGRIRHAKVPECESQTIYNIANHEPADLVISVGGGAVVDAGKIVSHFLSVPHVSVPTVLSTDALISKTAVMRNTSNGQKIHLKVSAPVAVIVGVEITAKADRRLSVAGVLDVLSNASAITDADLAAERCLKFLPELAKTRALEAANMASALPSSDILKPKFQKQLTRAIIVSGLAMHEAGDSSPCSGSEHAISHAIDSLGCKKSPHGIQVGCAMLFCNRLRRIANMPTLPLQISAALESYKSDYLLPYHLGLSRASFLRAIHLAVGWRVDRYTCLDEVSRDLFEQALDEEFSSEDFSCDYSGLLK